MFQKQVELDSEDTHLMFYFNVHISSVYILSQHVCVVPTQGGKGHQNSGSGIEEG